MPIGRLGHSVDVRNIHRLLSHLPPAFIREMLLVDQLFSAAELQPTGFLSRVVPPSAVEAVALDMAETIAKKAPLGVRTTRQQIIDVLRSARRGDLESGELDRASRLFDSNDFREGVRAFFEKRTPRFEGS
jgi:enoyl-CoA hydratase/carnithine racemase